MNITITNDKAERLILTDARAELKDESREALGRDRCSWSCSEDKARLWPLAFELTLTGHFNSKKEGRLAARVVICGTWAKGAKAPQMADGVRVHLRRESVAAELGGWTQQEIVAGMVREKLGTSQIQTASMDAICKAVSYIADREDEKAQAHMDRAAAARSVATILKKK